MQVNTQQTCHPSSLHSWYRCSQAGHHRRTCSGLPWRASRTRRGHDITSSWHRALLIFTQWRWQRPCRWAKSTDLVKIPNATLRAMTMISSYWQDLVSSVAVVRRAHQEARWRLVTLHVLMIHCPSPLTWLVFCNKQNAVSDNFRVTCNLSWDFFYHYQTYWFLSTFNLAWQQLHISLVRVSHTKARYWF